MERLRNGKSYQRVVGGGGGEGDGGDGGEGEGEGKGTEGVWVGGCM
jgi:hypothetical protein